eukprot:m.723446 g.723446  ORF g.723446 m.723446 type:complete len:272 (+) comp23022_c0_seq4:2-817(+)
MSPVGFSYHDVVGCPRPMAPPFSPTALLCCVTLFFSFCARTIVLPHHFQPHLHIPASDSCCSRVHVFMRSSCTRHGCGGADAAHEDSRGADPLSFKPNLNNLAPKLGNDTAEDEDAGAGSGQAQPDRGTGAYVPPRLTAMPYNDDVSASEKKRDRELKAQARMLNSEMMRELKEEISTTPLEVSHKNDIKSATAAELKEWEDIEESNFVRISGKRKLLKKQRARMAEDLSGITSFDVTAGLVHATDETSKKRSMRQQMGDAKKRRLSKGRK